MLLMGNASHKRNDLAALALSTARLSWLRRIIGVNLAMPVRTTLESRFGAANCEWHENVSTAEIVRLYSRAQVFMSLSMEEGFGLPYVEALSAGCVVIGIRQAVTVEILSHAAVLLDDGGVTAISEQLEALNPSEWPSEQVRRERAAEFSWDAAAATMLSVLRSACDR
jgi:glycosyltransferase involved in cell wall biosynthesis